TRGVENTKTISVIDVMKMIRVPEDVTLNWSRMPDILPIPDMFPDNLTIMEANTSFWDAITTNPNIAGNPNREQLVIRLFYESISPEMRFLLVNEDYSKTLIFVDMPTMDVINTKKAVNELNSIFADSDVRISELTGTAAIAVAVNDMLLESSFQTLALSLILVFIVLLVAFRSMKYAVITLIPVALITGYQPLTLRLFGMDLNLLTGMVGSIIVGIGIDFGIHMTERIRERGETIRNVKYAVETSGMSFFESTVTVLLGMSSALLAGIPSANQFVYMIAFLFALCMLGAMILLPAIYSIKILGE
ncbi:MAG: MMPL family transporter, partial [Thermoplasmata archaeon]|nr:MMPL family transporter [Thermoplasmata archaeon]